jgi:hypothetical protein
MWFILNSFSKMLSGFYGLEKVFASIWAEVKDSAVGFLYKLRA